MPGLNPASLFHTGVVVADLEAAMEALGPQLGVTWTNIADTPDRIRLRDGSVVEVPFRLAYSVGGSHRYELVQECPGTLWTATPGSIGTLHHVGYWSEDLAADGAELERRGAPLVATEATDSALFHYHRSALGFYIELVSELARPYMEEMDA